LVLEDLLNTIVSTYKGGYGEFTNYGRGDQDVERLCDWQLHSQPRYSMLYKSICKLQYGSQNVKRNFALPKSQKELDIFDLRSYLPWLAQHSEYGFSEDSRISSFFRLAARKLQTELDNFFLWRCTFKFQLSRSISKILQHIVPVSTLHTSWNCP